MLLLSGAPTATPEAIFRSAIEDFEFGEHAAAAKKLESVLSPIQLQSREDVIVARQYLGACFQLLDDHARAEEQFLLLLAMDPTHKLDPEVFSPALVQLFEQVREKTKVEPTPPPPVAAPPPGPPPPSVGIGRPAPTHEPHSAALSLVPFGVGQFANEQPVKGAVFAGAEVALFATAVTTFAMFESLKIKTIDGATGEVLSVEFRPEDADRARTLQNVYLATFWTGVAVAAAGIVEALMSYPGDDVGTVDVESGPGALVVRF